MRQQFIGIKLIWLNQFHKNFRNFQNNITWFFDRGKFLIFKVTMLIIKNNKRLLKFLHEPLGSKLVSQDLFKKSSNVYFYVKYKTCYEWLKAMLSNIWMTPCEFTE